MSYGAFSELPFSTLPVATSGGITGTGTTSQAQTAAGTAQLGHQGAGATSQAQTSAGAGVIGHQGTGSTSQAQTAAGTGTVAPATGITGTGATSQAQTAAGVGEVSSNTQPNGGVPWNPYAKTGETEEQKRARRIAQGIIQKAKEPDADIPALFEEAKEVSGFLKSDIERLDRQAAEYAALLEKRRTKLRMQAYSEAKNDGLALRQIQAELIQIQLQTEAQAQLVEEIDVVFMVAMLAAM